MPTAARANAGRAAYRRQARLDYLSPAAYTQQFMRQQRAA